MGIFLSLRTQPESFEVASYIVNKERVSQTDILPLKVHGILSERISKIGRNVLDLYHSDTHWPIQFHIYL